MSNLRSPADTPVIRDANEAVASVAYRLSEVIAIYPITPASAMAEHCDEWAAAGEPNLWGAVPEVEQLQSEAGAAGAVHGALQAGALATTFTSSQGLLLMIPTLYKLAGELTPGVIHVAARALATQALSIFGDHSDVMACRQTGAILLASASVQEAQDLAAVSHAAALSARLPILHFFDGFRTSHEIVDHQPLSDETLNELIDPASLASHRARALDPDRPSVRGTAQNPDTFFQARETVNPRYAAAPGILAAALGHFAAITGRRYALYGYHGAPDADRVIVVMGSGAAAAKCAADRLNAAGEKTGVLIVRLFRPFARDLFLSALPATVRAIAVLDRTKEPGSAGEPLYQDVLTALCESVAEGRRAGPLPRIVGGRFGLASKEFTPGMAGAVFANLSAPAPKNHFTVGIDDDVSHTSLAYEADFAIEAPDGFRAVFYGLGADGTVSSNKNSIAILGAETGRHVQAYFVYDSKKAGAVTVSHLRLSPRPIDAPWLIREAPFVACHHPGLLDKLHVTETAAPGAALLLNLPGPRETAWAGLPPRVRQDIRRKKLRVYAVDAAAVAQAAGLGRRISTVMQTCFFTLSGLLPRERAIELIKAAARKAYGRKGPEVAARNEAAIDQAAGGLYEIVPPPGIDAPAIPVPPGTDDFIHRVTLPLLAGLGDSLPVSLLPADGVWPPGTAKLEKRAIATAIPIWDASLCIQCNKCALVCPHAAIRPYVFTPEHLSTAPAGFAALDYKGPEFTGWKYAIQVAPDDCTGCDLCVHVCPAVDKTDPAHKSLNMVAVEPVRAHEQAAYEFTLSLPQPPRDKVKRDLKGSQLFEPLFEFSGACAGCGETPYVKLLSQLFGDRLLIANATGCSSIYGGNLPTTPWTTNAEGRGPAWANSLFEDNAEFGLGFRLALDAKARLAVALLHRFKERLPEALITGLLTADQENETGIFRQRERVHALRALLTEITDADASRLAEVAETLAKRSVWIVGGDGWAYDIGFGGVDQVLSGHHDVNLLVLDTEGYSNTGGQMSKATPLGAIARFATGGKTTGKKDLGLLAMHYGHAYVASVALGAKDAQTVKAFQEAESFPGPSLIVAYSHCISHGYDMGDGLSHQKLAVGNGIWPLYRFDPRRKEAGLPPFQLDSGPIRSAAAEYLQGEERFRTLARRDPARFAQVEAATDAAAKERRVMHEAMAKGVAPGR